MEVVAQNTTTGPSTVGTNPTFLSAKNLGASRTNQKGAPGGGNVNKSVFRTTNSSSNVPAANPGEKSAGLGKKRPLDFVVIGKGADLKKPKLSDRAGQGLSDPSKQDAAANEPSAEQVEAEETEEQKEEKRMQKEISKMKDKIHKSKEQAAYWRRKSIDLQSALDVSKTKAKLSIGNLEEKIEELTASRLELQAKLAEDTATNEKALDELAKLLDNQKELEQDKERLLVEIDTLQSSCNEAKEERWSQIKELQECLSDTLGDLKTKLAELTTAKDALKRAKARVAELQQQAVAAKTTVDEGASSELKHKCNRREERIAQLTGLVEKLVFKASVLSQTNTELKKKVEGGDAAAKPKDAETFAPLPNKMALLEEMCLKRYSKIMKQAAGRMYEAKHGAPSPADTDADMTEGGNITKEAAAEA